jgi:hypothetical protein
VCIFKQVLRRWELDDRVGQAHRAERPRAARAPRQQAGQRCLDAREAQPGGLGGERPVPRRGDRAGPQLAVLPLERGDARGQLADAIAQPARLGQRLGSYPVITSQYYASYIATTLYQVSYHIQWLFS